MQELDFVTRYRQVCKQLEIEMVICAAIINGTLDLNIIN